MFCISEDKPCEQEHFFFIYSEHLIVSNAVFQMNLDMFKLPEIFFSRQTFSSCYVVFKYKKAE